MRAADLPITLELLGLVVPMWGRRKKVTRLTEELRNLAAVDRLYLIHLDDLTEQDHHAHLSRQRRKAEILVEIANLNASRPAA